MGPSLLLGDVYLITEMCPLGETWPISSLGFNLFGLNPFIYGTTVWPSPRGTLRCNLLKRNGKIGICKRGGKSLRVPRDLAPNLSLYACLVLGDGRNVGDKRIRPDEIQAKDKAFFGSKKLCSSQSVGFARKQPRHSQ